MPISRYTHACKDFLHAQALRSQTQSQTMRPDAAQDPDPHLCSGPATPPNAVHGHEMWPSMSPPWCLQPWLHRAAGWAQGSWHLPAGRLRVGEPTGDMGAKTPRAVSPPALWLPAATVPPSPAANRPSAISTLTGYQFPGPPLL